MTNAGYDSDEVEDMIEEYDTVSCLARPVSPSRAEPDSMGGRTE